MHQDHILHRYPFPKSAVVAARFPETFEVSQGSYRPGSMLLTHLLYTAHLYPRKYTLEDLHADS